MIRFQTTSELQGCTSGAFSKPVVFFFPPFRYCRCFSPTLPYYQLITTLFRISSPLFISESFQVTLTEEVTLRQSICRLINQTLRKGLALMIVLVT